jgi:hypothetical protein
MRRRDFIKGIASSAVAWPLAVRAQQAESTPRIGLLWPGDAKVDVIFASGDLAPKVAQQATVATDAAAYKKTNR